MELQLLPFEESMKLKEIGFDWPTLDFYSQWDGVTGVVERKRFPVENSNAEVVILPPGEYREVSRPTLDLACKWFRDLHDIHIHVKYEGLYGGIGGYTVHGYVCWVKKKGNSNQVGYSKNYENAQLIGIRDAIGWLSENSRKCLKCGGQGKPSKALSNEIAKLYTEDARELGGHAEVPSGAAKMVDCIKCGSCGHSWVEGSGKNHNKNT